MTYNSIEKWLLCTFLTTTCKNYIQSTDGKFWLRLMNLGGVLLFVYNLQLYQYILENGRVFDLIINEKLLSCLILPWGSSLSVSSEFIFYFQDIKIRYNEYHHNKNTQNYVNCMLKEQTTQIMDYVEAFIPTARQILRSKFPRKNADKMRWKLMLVLLFDVVKCRN